MESTGFRGRRVPCVLGRRVWLGLRSPSHRPGHERTLSVAGPGILHSGMLCIFVMCLSAILRI